MRHCIAQRARRRVESSQLDHQRGFSLPSLFHHGQHRFPRAFVRIEQSAIALSEERGLAQGIAQNRLVIVGYCTDTVGFQGHVPSDEASARA